MNKDQREIQRKLRILQFGRTSFYRWRQAFAKHGEAVG
jgi:hypothetical protein